jgi:drug/metabolite transporter (DMT)-like permease
MLPIVLALLASFFFAFSNIVAKRGLARMDYFTGLLINLITNASLLWCYLLVSSDSIQIWVRVNLIFAGVGLFVPSVARFFMFQGIERLGASITSTAGSSSPLFAIVFAVFFLKELPTPTNLLGALAIVAGIVCLSWQGQTKRWRTRDLTFPLSAAFLFAARDNVVRFGLLITRSPMLAATIAATTSALTMGAAYAARSRRPGWAQTSLPGFMWFFASGFLNFLSYICMYTALGLDRISVVSPIVSTYSVFVLPLAVFFLKGIEQVNARKVIATMLVVLGVLLIWWTKL